MGRPKLACVNGFAAKDLSLSYLPSGRKVCCVGVAWSNYLSQARCLGYMRPLPSALPSQAYRQCVMYVWGGVDGTWILSVLDKIYDPIQVIFSAFVMQCLPLTIYTNLNKLARICKTAQ